MKKVTIISLILAVILLLGGTLTAYAFYAYTQSMAVGDQPTFSLDENGSKTISVGTEIELFRNTQDGYYNTSLAISEVNSSRVTVKLTADITLYNDLLITADCHLDLGGYSLILNGHSIMVTHGYTGTFVICNGYIEPFQSTDKIYIDTPNAAVIVDLVVRNGDTTLLTDDYVEIVNIDRQILSYNVFYMVSQMLNNNTDGNAKRLNYGEIRDYFTIDEDGDGNADNTNYDGMYFLSSAHNYCTQHGSETAPYYSCYYCNTDVDLPFTYFNYPLTISYTSSDSTVIDQHGVLGSNLSGITDVDLTASILFEGDSEAYASKTFVLHVYSPTDNASAVTACESLIGDYFGKYYGTTDTNDDDIDDFTGYIFNGEICVPETEPISGATVVCEVYDENDVLLDTSATFTDGVSAGGYFRQEEEGTFIMKITVDASSFKYICSKGAQSSGSALLPVLGTREEVKDDYTIAQSIILNWYGSKLTITNVIIDTENSLNGYTTQVLYTDIAPYADDGVESVSYSLVNNIDNTYAISAYTSSNYRLHVRTGMNPNTLQSVFIKATFVFSESIVEITVPVVYSPDSSTGNTQVHPFLPYYTYFNRVFHSVAGSTTMVSFDMPLYYAAGSPVICLSLSGDDNGAVTLALYYNGASHVIATDATNTTYPLAFDAYLTANNLTIEDLINYGDAKWQIIINTDFIGTVDNEIVLTYFYKFGDGSTGGYSYTGKTWVEYTSSSSSFVLPGIIRCVFKNGTTTHTDTSLAINMPDRSLYKWVYDNYNTYSYTYTYTTDYATKYILTSWLSQSVDLDNSGNSVGISNYQGIEYLDGMKVLNLNNSGVTTAAMEYIAGMAGLEQLYLRNDTSADSAKLRDQETSTIGFPTGDVNDFIATLSALSSLRVLDLAYNLIYDFNSLSDFTALDTVYTHNNQHTSTLSLGNLDLSGINNSFTQMVRSMYGSAGSTNMPAYQSMYQTNGTKVYYQNDSSYFTGGAGVTDYTKMTEIEYQERLPLGVSITSVYDTFSTNYLDYGINTPTGDVSNITITFGYTGDATTTTQFTMTYSYNLRVQQDGGLFGTDYDETHTITLVATFDVIRLGE